MRALVDMNLSPRWVEALNLQGIEAVHWSAVGAPMASDSEILAYAASHGLLVLTQDLDFGAILAAEASATVSVIQLRFDDLRPATHAESVADAIEANRDELARGALVTLEPGRTRLRVLPLRRGQ